MTKAKSLKVDIAFFIFAYQTLCVWAQDEESNRVISARQELKYNGMSVFCLAIEFCHHHRLMLIHLFWLFMHEHL